MSIKAKKSGEYRLGRRYGVADWQLITNYCCELYCNFIFIVILVPFCKCLGLIIAYMSLF